jgi:hypothetical protein
MTNTSFIRKSRSSNAFIFLFGSGIYMVEDRVMPPTYRTGRNRREDMEALCLARKIKFCINK